MKAKNKTQPLKISVESFLEKFSEQEKKSADILIKLFEKITKKKCIMWGPILGFGKYHYVYESGREGDFLATGFALRKNSMSFYLGCGYENCSAILKALGKYKLSGSCLHVKKLEDIDLKVLEKLIKIGLSDLSKKWKVE